MSDETSPAPSAATDPNAGVVPTEPKRREHYNTQFLVANFEKEERRTRLILVGVAVAIMAGIGAALMLGGGGGEAKKEEKPAVEGAAMEPAKPTTVSPPAAASKAAPPPAPAPVAAPSAAPGSAAPGAVPKAGAAVAPPAK